MKTISLILLLVAGVFGQVITKEITDQAENPKLVNTRYDKFKNLTFIDGGAEFLKPEGRGAILYNDVTFNAGCTISMPVPAYTVFLLTFTARSRTWNFLESHGLIFLADSVRLDIGKGSRSGEIYTGSRSVSVVEWLIYQVSRARLETIANAKAVELQVGGMEAKLTAEDQQRIKNVLAACK